MGGARGRASREAHFGAKRTRNETSSAQWLRAAGHFPESGKACTGFNDYRNKHKAGLTASRLALTLIALVGGGESMLASTEPSGRLSCVGSDSAFFPIT